MKPKRVVRGFKKNYWVNLAWLEDGGSEQYLYATKEEAEAVSDVPHEIVQSRIICVTGGSHEREIV